MLDETSTKIRSAHVDRLYVRRSHPFRSARFITTFACFAIALVWSIVYGLPSRSRVHDPGPLSSAHRQWQNDCKRCHDGAGATGMLKNVSLAVSDAACLQCHDGAVHQMNQTHFISADKTRSANCVTCHVEHKGGEALAANRDQTCVQCHRDLSSEMKGVASEVTNAILAFDSNKHPKFGRALEQKDGKPVDPTVLKFNHAIHMTKPEIQSNCVLCHEQRQPSPDIKPLAEKTPPPWKTNKDGPLGAIGSGDGRYTQPISYQRHCQACHELKLPVSDVAIAHEDMSLVRAQLRSMSAADLKGIGQFTPGQKSLGGRPAKKAQSANEGAIAKLNSMFAELPEAKRDSVLKQLEKLSPGVTGASDATTQPSSPPDANLAELYVAYAGTRSCAYCHEMQGEVPALATSRDALLTSVPTQIPDSPRRWFTASQFDHRAHRGASCIACHTEAKESTKTEQLLQPNIETCVTCHRSEHDKPALADTAPSNCITCHQFHDRRTESWGNGKLSLQDFAGKTSAQ
ncbi:MAG: cytochrome c3 family protein [Anaerolineae bacterium]|nr:cytochrome c3 family protein [Phycisphaerae bacterium]